MFETIWAAIIGGISGAGTAFVITYFREKAAQNRFESELQSKYELAAIDKRLQAHQEAYSLWWDMLLSILGLSSSEIEEPDYGKARKAIFDCLQWWV